MKLYDNITLLIDSNLPAQFSEEQAMDKLVDILGPRHAPSRCELRAMLRCDPRPRKVDFVKYRNGVNRGVWSFVE